MLFINTVFHDLGTISHVHEILFFPRAQNLVYEIL